MNAIDAKTLTRVRRNEMYNEFRVEYEDIIKTEEFLNVYNGVIDKIRTSISCGNYYADITDLNNEDFVSELNLYKVKGSKDFMLTNPGLYTALIYKLCVKDGYRIECLNNTFGKYNPVPKEIIISW